MQLLLDNNVFYLLTANSNSADPTTFLDRVRNAVIEVPGGASETLVPDNATLSLILTPFTLLEAIGIGPPQPELTLTYKTIGKGAVDKAVDAMIDTLWKQSVEFYEQSDAISDEQLQLRASEQRDYVRPSSLPFFDRCVTQLVGDKSFRRQLVASLAIDAVLKVVFPPAVAPHVHVRLLHTLHSSDELDNSVALFRVIRRMWENVFGDMKRTGIYRESDLNNMNRCMSIKNPRDYLDCELVHYLCVGYVSGIIRSPVVAVTTDAICDVKMRISIFKAIQETFRKMVSDSVGRPEDALVQYTPGVLMSCNADGSLRSALRVNDIRSL